MGREGISCGTSSVPAQEICLPRQTRVISSALDARVARSLFVLQREPTVRKIGLTQVLLPECALPAVLA